MLCTALQSRKVFEHALENRYAILAINADSHAAIVDCLDAAVQVNAPVIIETSLWQLKGRSFGAGNAIEGMAAYIARLLILANGERYRNIPVIYHTDHIKGPETIDILGTAIRGFDLLSDQGKITLRASTVSLDASDFDEDENIAHVLKLCKIADDASVPVTLEMESAVDEGITSEEETRKLLGSIEYKHPGYVHLWAPGVGTKHGFGDNMSFSPKTIEMHKNLTKQITGREIGIALHGSSGLSQQDLTEAARAGVVKVNWSTESLFIRSEASRRYYAAEDRFDKKNKEWKNNVMDNGMASYVSKEYIPRVADRMAVLNGAGQASELMTLFQV